MIFYEKFFPFTVANTDTGTFNGVSFDFSNFDSLVDIDISTQTQDFHQHLSDQNQVLELFSNSSTESVSKNDIFPIIADPVRFSTGLKKSPGYLSNYYCGTISSYSFPHFTTPYPLQSFLSYFKCSADHTSFCLSIFAHPKPHSFNEANKLDCWREAMMTKLHALQANKTWSLVKLPSGKPLVGCSWVNKVKYKAHDTLERYKARLVAQGFTQTKGVDFLKPFHQLPS